MQSMPARLHRRTLIQGLAAGVAGGLVIGGLAPTGASASSDPSADIAAMVNGERAARGLGSLGTDLTLTRVAQAWTAGMRDRRDLSHNGQRAESYGWPTTGIGEVVGYVGGITDLPAACRAMVAAWMGSRQHRDVLLGRWTHLGVGWATSTDNRLYATVDVLHAEITGPSRASIALSQELIDGGQARRVVIVRDDLPADGLAASGLVEGDIPFLLAPSDRPLPVPLLQEVSRALTRGGTVHLVGGGLHASADQQLRDLGGDPVRLRGADRYATAAIVADEVVRLRGAPPLVLVANGTAWADAAAAAGFAAAHGVPVLLTPKDSLHPAAAGALDRLGDVEHAVVGGPAVISDATAEQARAWRITGQDRADTGARLMVDIWATRASAGTPLIVTPGWTPDGWATALMHTTYAARHGAPLLFATDGVPGSVADALRHVGFGPAAPADLRFARDVSAPAREAFTRATR